MAERDRNESEHRVLILAPTGKDAELTQAILGKAGVASFICPGVESLSRVRARVSRGLTWPRHKSHSMQPNKWHHFCDLGEHKFPHNWESGAMAAEIRHADASASGSREV
jgi:hypothetical protein